MTLFRGKYRIESTRLRYWDYADYGWYFVTINVKGRKELLGKVVDGEVELSSVGKIVEYELLRTERRLAEVKLDTYEIMPDHLHIILVVDNLRRHPAAKTRRPACPTSSSNPRRFPHAAPRRVSGGAKPHEEPEPEQKLKAHSLGSVINSFKGKCTTRIGNKLIPDFEWQARYHDRVIRSEKELQRIREYIINNPAKWEEERGSSKREQAE